MENENDFVEEKLEYPMGQEEDQKAEENHQNENGEVVLLNDDDDDDFGMGMCNISYPPLFSNSFSTISRKKKAE